MLAPLLLLLRSMHQELLATFVVVRANFCQVGQVSSEELAEVLAGVSLVAVAKKLGAK
jgi:hypothetical protein